MSIAISPFTDSVLIDKVGNALRAERKGVHGPVFYGSGPGWAADWEHLTDITLAVNAALAAFTAAGGGERSSIQIEIKPATWTGDPAT